MEKTRINIPKNISEKVLKEFNYKCAICGAEKPHLHHINEDPSDNNIENLLPLCPNCHLIDLHNPTDKIDTKKLYIFRKYKDPLILGPKFHTLFIRLLFLYDLTPDSDLKIVRDNIEELTDFINALEMGSFYAKKIKDLLKKPAKAYSIGIDGPDYEYLAAVRRDNQEYLKQVQDKSEDVLNLSIELLRYQNWNKK